EGAELRVLSPVCIVDGLERLEADEQRELLRHSALECRAHLEDGAQVDARDELGGEEVPLLRMSEIEDLHDVGVMELDGLRGFLDQDVDKRLVTRVSLVDLFDQQRLLEAFDTTMGGAKHLSEFAEGPYPMGQLIGTKLYGLG